MRKCGCVGGEGLFFCRLRGLLKGFRVGKMMAEAFRYKHGQYKFQRDMQGLWGMCLRISHVQARLEA